MRLTLAVIALMPFFFSSGAARAQVPAAAARVVTAQQVDGTWRCKGGEFRIWSVGKRRLRVEFSGIYEYQTPGGPIANLGEARGNASIDGVSAVFKPNGTADRCTITMTFKHGRLLVVEVGECGFGKHVSSNGVYRRVSSRKPKFGKKIPWLALQRVSPRTTAQRSALGLFVSPGLRLQDLMVSGLSF
jgi:hypothetical protein